LTLAAAVTVAVADTAALALWSTNADPDTVAEAVIDADANTGLSPVLANVPAENGMNPNITMR
jgi:hypothetical protein